MEKSPDQQSQTEITNTEAKWTPKQNSEGFFLNF
jgi:hypothetical protein